MKKRLFAVLLAPLSLLGQLTMPDSPSFIEEMVLEPDYTVEIPAPESDDLLQLQFLAQKKQRLMPMGKIIPIAVDFGKSKTIEVDEFTQSESVEVHSAGAKGLTVYMSEVFLPIGSKLYVSNHIGTQIYGPFTLEDVKNERLVPSMIDGESIKITTVYNRSSSLKPRFNISELGYNFGDLTKPKNEFGSRDFGDSENCQVNANCNEGANWRRQQKAVVRIKMRIQNFEGWCTGTIMNNTLQDCTPYVVTADHCREVEGQEASLDNYNDWQFYFNYEGADCSNPRERDVAIGSQTGCKRVAYTQRQGSGGPDHLLVKLSDNIDGSIYDHHYAGWQNFDKASRSGVMIHHPAGDVKKISTYTTAIVNSAWEPSIKKDTHWEVYWASTENGKGVSEPGSSGSSLFNDSGLVIGVLTGGASACKEDTDKGVSPNFPDYFGKFSLAFGYKGSDKEHTLFEHLDGSNHTPILKGIDWPCSQLALNTEDLGQLYQNQIKVFPNPAQSVINLETEGIDISSMKVLNSQGVTVFEPTESLTVNRINVENWATGIYVIQLQTSSNMIINKKFIVE